MSISTTVVGSGSIVAGERNTTKEAERASFLRVVADSLLGRSSFFTSGDLAVDAELAATWGLAPWATKAERPTLFAVAFNGHDVPEAYQVRDTVRTVVQTITAGSGDQYGHGSNTTEGQASVDTMRAKYPSWATAVSLSLKYTYMSGKTIKTTTVPAGQIGGRSDRQLAQTIWAYRDALPKHLSGKDRDKYTAAIRCLCTGIDPRVYKGTTNGQATPTVGGTALTAAEIDAILALRGGK